MSGGFFRGTSADQDTRFSNKQAKLLKSQKFAPELEHLVDMTKVKMDVIRPWIATRVTELLGFEDEVLINFVYGLLEGKEADGKQIQIQLTGFMEKNTGKFMKELWGLLLSAQKNASGVPQQFLDAKEQELKNKQYETERIGLEGRRKERGGWGPEPNKLNKMEGRADIVEAVDGPRSVTSAAVSSAKQSSMEDRSPRLDDNVKMDRGRGSRRKIRHSTSAHSDDNSLSSNRRSPTASRSRSRSFSNSRSLSEERHRSCSVSVSPRHHRRSVSPERRYPSPKRHVSPRRAPRSPARRQSPHHRRSSTSRSRHRSPLVRRRSPLRRISPNLRPRSPSPLRHRSPSPYRYISPSPRHRYSPRRRSPVHIRRRSPSPHRSPIRRRTPPRHLSPPRRGSPPPWSPRYRRRSPAAAAAPKWSHSPRRSQSPQRPRRSPNRSPVPSSEKTRGLDIGYKRPDPSLRKQTTAGSPSYKLRDANNNQNVATLKSASPEKSKLSLRDRDGKSNGKGMHAPSLSPDRHSKERRLRDSSDASGGEERAPRHYAKLKVDSSHNNHPALNSKSRKVAEEMSQSADVSHERQTLNQLDEGQARLSHRNASSNANSQHERPVRRISHSPQDVEYGPGVVGGGSLPSDPVYDRRTSAKRYSSEIGRHSHELKKSTSVSEVDDRRSTLKLEDNDNVPGFDKKTKRKVDQQDLGSNSEDDRAYKGPLAARKSMNNRNDTSDDESGSHSDSIDRKERKRRKKEEKKLRKEEKRWRREERHRRKEERRAAKHKSKHLDTEAASDDDQNLDHSDNEVERERKSSDKEDTESEQKKLEIRLREKALESLRAKKAIAH